MPKWRHIIELFVGHSSTFTFMNIVACLRPSTCRKTSHAQETANLSLDSLNRSLCTAIGLRGHSCSRSAMYISGAAPLGQRPSSEFTSQVSVEASHVVSHHPQLDVHLLDGRQHHFLILGWHWDRKTERDQARFFFLVSLLFVLLSFFTILSFLNFFSRNFILLDLIIQIILTFSIHFIILFFLKLNLREVFIFGTDQLFGEFVVSWKQPGVCANHDELGDITAILSHWIGTCSIQGQCRRQWVLDLSMWL